MVKSKLKFTALLFIAAAVWLVPSYAAIKQNTVEHVLSEAKKAGLKPNRLISEGSPYLLQHAYNPVHWYAWGEEAFEKARKENKPIFLSIGYSTCHWCHVMAHESFENEQVAKILNEHFISIKVDREERPDIDNVYMAATQLINGSGGWPMTVFLNNKLEPFHAGTYYPRESVDGYKGFIELLQTINGLWLKERESVDAIATAVTEKIRSTETTPAEKAVFRADIHDAIFDEITQAFDTEYGGFGNAPKFPRHGLFAYLSSVIHYGDKKDSDKKQEAIFMLQKTLDEMAHGGIYDQIGGGFHRYSVDEQWQVPHFEKMLYSQALMTIAYIDLYAVTKSPLYERVINQTLDFVEKEMTHPRGGFYSALDADSAKPENSKEKAEGAYYLWSAAELERLLTEDESMVINAYFNILKKGNIRLDPQEEFGEKNILYVSDEYTDTELSKIQRESLSSAFKKLNSVRFKRPRPHLDDKIITAWNGMMISALSKAYQGLNNSKHLESAKRAARFVEKHLLDKKTFKLNRRMRAGKASIESGLSDYVWFIRGLIDLYHASNNKHWLSLATRLQKKQDQLFYDKNGAAYFESGSTDKSILFRSKTAYDGALPAENAVAIENLYELSELTGNKEWKHRTEQSLNSFASVANVNPAACASLLAIKYQNQ